MASGQAAQGEIRLLDEVDIISAVSGGCYTAAYYGLFGDRIFDDFEDKFLRLDYDLVNDEQERKSLKDIPTSFALEAEQVDHLIEISNTLLTNSQEYQRLIGDFNRRYK